MASPRVGKTTVLVLHDAQLLLNKNQQIWGGVYNNYISTDIFRAVPIRQSCPQVDQDHLTDRKLICQRIVQ